MVNRYAFGPEFVLLRDAMQQLLQDSFVPSGGARSPWGNGEPSMARPMPLDVYATPEEAIILAAVPGMRPQDLEITYDQNTVTLSGRVAPAGEQDQNATWYLHEIWSGQVERTVSLPFEVDPSQAEATFENGIVRVSLPKAAWAKPHKITVTASQSTPEAIGAGSASK